MKRFFTFVLLGSGTALVCEFAFNIFVAHTYGNFIFTIFLYPVYLSLFYCLQQFVLHSVAKRPTTLFVLTYFVGGTIGLAIEWFIIGNSPSGNPDAIQWGMWVYWAAVVCIPTLYLQDPKRGKRTFISLIAIYGGISLLMWLLLPPSLAALIIIWQVIFYTYLHLPYFLHLRALKREVVQ